MSDIIPYNYHTHTNFCDGRDSLEEMTAAAIRQNLKTIGFSGHSYTAYDESYCMSHENTLKYKQEIKRLQEKYKGKIEILCGIEQDFGSDEPTEDYEYVIGSVHCIFEKATLKSKDMFHGYDRNHFFYVDWSIDKIIDAVNNHFSGDPYAFCERYYEMVTLLPEVTHCNIIGHFDLVTKFNEKTPWFDESNPRYIHAYEKALSLLLRKNVIFEINTGAMARGFRTEPYPSSEILKEIKKGNGSIMINSDSHSVNTETYGFDHALDLAKSCGFTKIKKITSSGFEDVII